MSHKEEIKEGAIFIADAHENSQRRGFLGFLKKLESGQIPSPPQLFLMGDIFDLLVGDITHTKELHEEHIKLLEKLAQNFPIYYFEGNHDFNLKKLFLHVKVYSINEQPAVFTCKGKKVLLLHGDKYGSLGDKIYTFIIRNTLILKSLNCLNELLGRLISNKLLNFLEKKNICSTFKNFKNSTLKRLENYSLCDDCVVFEGHFHQNKSFECNGKQYVNFSSFACDQSYFIVQFDKSIKFAQLK